MDVQPVVLMLMGLAAAGTAIQTVISHLRTPDTDGVPTRLRRPGRQLV